MTASDAPADSSSSPQEGAQGQEQGSEETLSPEALRAELNRARQDAARYRARAKEFADDGTYKRAKEAVTALEKAEQDKKSETERLTEKNEQLLYRASDAETSLARLRVALNAGVDPSQVDEFASRLRGDDEDALKKDAEQLARFFQSSSTPARRGDPSQGRGSDGQPAVDPLQAALEDKLGIAH